MSAAIRVRSREGEDVPWPAEAACRAGVLAGWMRETDANGSFLVPSASASALHALAAMCTQDSVDPADVATHSFVQLAEIIHAAHFLEATAALGAASRALCARLRGKTTGELRLLLGVQGDLSEAEQAQAIKEPLFEPPDAPAEAPAVSTAPHRSVSSALANEDAIEEALAHAEAATLVALKGVSSAWRGHARSLLSARLCRRDGRPAPARREDVTDLDVQRLVEAGRVDDATAAGQLPNLVRLHAYGHVADLAALRAAPGPPSTLENVRRCCVGVGEAPAALLAAAVLAQPGIAAIESVPIEALRSDTLRTLELHDERIGLAHAMIVAGLLPSAASLEAISLNSFYDRPLPVKQLRGAEPVVGPIRLEGDGGLNVRPCHLTATSAIVIGALLSHNRSLTELGLPYNRIGADGARWIACAVKCHGSSLRILDLSNNNNIGATGAEWLAAALSGGSTLTSLDLSNTNLCSSLSSQSDDYIAAGIDALAGALRDNSSLTSLVLSRNSLGPEGVASIADALKVNHSLQRLDLSQTRVCGTQDGRGTYTTDGIAALADALPANGSLLELTLDETGVEGTRLLGEAVKRNSSLQTIQLAPSRPLRVTQLKGMEPVDSLTFYADSFSENGLRHDESLVLVGVLVGANSSITSLEMSGGLCGLHPNSCDQRGVYTTARLKAVGEGLKYNASLKSLRLRHNKMRDDGATLIAEYLKSAGLLMELDLYRNQIGASGTAALMDALVVNPTLTSLDLGDNPIGDAGAVSIGKALAVNRSLTVLDIACENGGKAETKIGDEGAEAIAGALRANSALTSLNLDSHRIGGQGAKALADALRDNGTLVFLGLNANPISGHWDNEVGEFRATPEGHVALAAALGLNRSLRSLGMYGSGALSPEGAEALAAALELGCTLVSLTVNCCSDGSGVSKLPRAVVGSSTIESYNGMPIKAMRANSVTELRSDSFCRRGRRASYPMGVGNEGCAVIAGLLPTMTSLEKLALRGADVGDEGARVLADVLPVQASSLTTLDLGGNRIGDDGATAIATAIAASNFLAQLHLDGNRIGDDGATAIATAVAANNCLTKLNLDENRIRVAGVKAFTKTLSLDTSLVLQLPLEQAWDLLDEEDRLLLDRLQQPPHLRKTSEKKKQPAPHRFSWRYSALACLVVLVAAMLPLLFVS